MARILIVDDEALVRITVRAMLESAGHDIVEAKDGRQCVKMYRADPVEMLVTDLIMPEQEGIETIVELRADFPDLKIIAISGGGRLSNNDLLKYAKQLGANSVLPKPFSRAQLLAEVNALLPPPRPDPAPLCDKG